MRGLFHKPWNKDPVISQLVLESLNQCRVPRNLYNRLKSEPLDWRCGLRQRIRVPEFFLFVQGELFVSFERFFFKPGRSLFFFLNLFFFGTPIWFSLIFGNPYTPLKLTARPWKGSSPKHQFFRGELAVSFRVSCIFQRKKQINKLSNSNFSSLLFVQKK